MEIKGLKVSVAVNASFKVDNFEAPEKKVEGFKMKDTGASVNFELEEVSLQPDEMKGLTEMISGVVRDQFHLKMEKEMRKAEEAKLESERRLKELEPEGQVAEMEELLKRSKEEAARWIEAEKSMKNTLLKNQK